MSSFKFCYDIMIDIIMSSWSNKVDLKEYKPDSLFHLSDDHTNSVVISMPVENKLSFYISNIYWDKIILKGTDNWLEMYDQT